MLRTGYGEVCSGGRVCVEGGRWAGVWLEEGHVRWPAGLPQDCSYINKKYLKCGVIFSPRESLSCNIYIVFSLLFFIDSDDIIAASDVWNC